MLETAVFKINDFQSIIMICDAGFNNALLTFSHSLSCGQKNSAYSVDRASDVILFSR